MIQVSETAKEDFCSFCSLLYQKGLVSGIGGNICTRAGAVFLLTPTGYSLRNLQANMVSVISTNGEHLQGPPPSKEGKLHLQLLNKRHDINVSCHVHGAYIIAASSMVKPGDNSLPPLTPGFVYLAYPLPMLPFFVPGSEELVSRVIDKLAHGAGKAVLLQNHGLITLGENYAEAIDIAEEIDEACRVFILTGGMGRVLSAQQVRAIKEISRS